MNIHEETLKIARNLIKKDPSLTDWVISKFPELIESEDERIRNFIIKVFKDSQRNGISEAIMPEQYDKVFAWLEKQGEQTPKHFELKAGHWYICHRAFCCRADHLTVKEGERFMCEKDGIVKGFMIKEPEKYFKEVCAPAPMEDEQKPAIEMKSAEESLGIDSNTYNKIVDKCIYGEQKQDVNIQINPSEYINDMGDNGCYLKNTVQKPIAWSEEGENIRLRLIDYLYGKSHLSKDREDGISWLKSLKDKYTWKPSVEQMDALSFYIKNDVDNDGVFGRQLVKLYQDLKKLMED